MSSNQQYRQSELLQAENWSVVYKAFSAVNLQAYDFDSIRQALYAYISQNYPESYSDWISSSEMVMMIDLVAYLGQSLAFRTDLNSRENFIDTAQRRDSILKLARTLSYSPKRNFPARGVLKLTGVQTDQNIQDSIGNNLTNQTITWNDPTNVNWYEQFILILNNVFSSTTPFGLPVQQATIGGILSQLYQMNSVPLTTVADTFTADIVGQTMNFEIVNPTFDPLGFFTEETPDPMSAKNIIYRNDGAGNSSPNTGFFSYFKQGSLQFNDYQFTYPLQNRIINVTTNNINQLDVWVQEINGQGLVVNTWTQVPTTENIAFTSIGNQTRTIYSVITQDNDQVAIKFGDGSFGQSPTGLFRVWYRVSNGLTYQIQSTDLENIQIVIPYYSSNNNVTQQQNLTLTYNLQYGISVSDVGASVARETNAQVQSNASQVYYTQNRMVNGEDYNVFPLQYGNLALKVKAVNRIYSGQSRYIDINDPTGNYQNTILYGEDGILYEELYSRTAYENLPTVKSFFQIVTSDIQPLLLEQDLYDFVIANYPRFAIDNAPYPTRWRQPINNSTTTTGELVADVTFTNTYVPQEIGADAGNNYVYITTGTLIKFTNPANITDYIWAEVVQVTGNGTAPDIDITGIGPVVLSQTIPNLWRVTSVITSFRQTLTTAEVNAAENQLFNSTTFALRFDIPSLTWIVVLASNIDYADAFSLANAGNNTNSNLDASWLLLAEYLPSQGYWQFSTRNLRYIFESANTARFYFINTFKIIDVTQNLPLIDYVKILKYNTYNTPSTTALGQEYVFNFLSQFTYPDGYVDPRRVQVTFGNAPGSNVIIDPDIFNIVVDPNATITNSSLDERYVYQVLTTSGDYQYYIPAPDVITFSTIANITNTSLPIGSTCYVIDNETFYLRNSDLTLSNVTSNYQAFIGRNDLAFQWKHYAPEDQRIDPASTNIQDIYVLTQAYYQATQNWLTSVNQGPFPTPPTTNELYQLFQPLENSAMMSDEIVWHSAQFKLLFGPTADPALQAQFVCIAVPGTTYTNNEIQQMVITAINAFFNVQLWSFGSTFFMSELSAYLHQQMSGILGSVVIVPLNPAVKFGNLYQIKANYDQLFMSTASVSSVSIVTSYNAGNLNIGS